MISKDNCCGCMACFNICPTNAIIMEEDEEGFLYPKIDDKKCINCGLCKKVCDFNDRQDKNDKKDGKVFAVKHNSNDVRNTSTSGGMFTALYTKIIEEKGVVYGATLDSNLDAKHIRCETLEECALCKGSKYVQSNSKDIYPLIANDLKAGKKVLLTGTACQIEGIKSYLNLKKIPTDNLITCDFICHGVPSNKVFRDHIKNLELKHNSKVVSYRFRTKTHGWVGHHEEATLENGRVLSKGKYLDIYKQLYGTLCIIRPSCYNCKYAKEEHYSDITIGDFWGLETSKDNFFDNLGVSFVMINSKKGEELFNQIKDKISYVEKDISECRNPQLHGPVKFPNTRRVFWDEYNKNGYMAVAKRYTTLNKKILLKNNIYKVIKLLKLEKVVNKVRGK